jgi:2-dehydro-3-deoxyphosphogluconate aldolase/(4S)-4-hydroxy-2-oxoglutarate aldolase
MRQWVEDIDLSPSAPILAREEIRARIAEVGVVPAVRLSSEEDALFAAETILEAGVPVIEVSMTFPGAVHILSRLVNELPNMIVGAGGVLDRNTAYRCVNEGAKFLATEGLILEVMEFAAQEEVVVFSGALTPTEIISAWKAGSDFVKVVPCDSMGGHSYIRSLKTALPQVRLIAAGGVDQNSALDFIRAGAAALGVGKELIPADAIRLRQAQRIRELARRFLTSIDSGRS